MFGGLNAHFPIVAFATPSEEGETKFRFVDAPELAKAFKDFDLYEVLTSSQARRRATPDDCLQLSRAEREQVRYWRPRTLGEILFNFWD